MIHTVYDKSDLSLPGLNGIWINFCISGQKIMVSEWGTSKKSCGLSTYDKWNSKPQISYIFNFDRVSDGRMAHVWNVK